jgi:hypothetical protein
MSIIGEKQNNQNVRIVVGIKQLVTDTERFLQKDTHKITSLYCVLIAIDL